MAVKLMRASGVVATSSTQIYTPNAVTGSRGAYVYLIQLANVNSTTTQTVSVTVKSSGGTEYSLIKNASIPAGASLQVVGGSKLVLMAGDVILAVAGSATQVEYTVCADELS